MNYKIYIAVLLGLLLVTSCEEYTDIKPKGKNLLETADELEYLLNYDFNSSASFNFFKYAILVNDMYSYGYGQVPTVIANANKDLEYVRLVYDEEVDRAALTASDRNYEGLYSIISTRLNMILEQAPNVNDDPAKVEQLRAEALVLRAYLHYIVVNIYARAYDPVSASTDGGIAYMQEIDFEKSPVKSTVEEVYNFMLADLNEAIELNSLPNKPANSMRVGKAFAYAVKAKVLLSMRKYGEALEAANSSLSIKNTYEDHREQIGSLSFARNGMYADDNLFFITSQDYNPTMCNVSADIYDNYYEEGNIFKEATDIWGFPLLDQDYGLMYSGINGAALWYAPDYYQNSAGMTTADVYLIKAECLIRTGKINEGIDVINELREYRINPDVYSAQTATTEEDAMEVLKKVSRVEFICTWKNYVNIKRWNTEESYKETIRRDINGVVYELTPESSLWVSPFPQSATDFNENLTQNY
ncbi:RagB/SusD family nutrient uptake outer membrane protein [Plebeiibacterium marinum]|uniref:RagB/SusD family nutrient uptake outer membrane protein n=1 Tax=Plebeiibacterium marinum TaxID=2992111 RepID=A0AAE3MB27_9BACT|nr:RagB/SusD family nutrient uptake outer membrane protein [Plebeiobacterium marinum]MCW3804536.1 RagB/SusD family nutrient uptake outer membrane protein [Plebeiobacterium marinum]